LFVHSVGNKNDVVFVLVDSGGY